MADLEEFEWRPLMMRFLKWLRGGPKPRPDWQELVDNLALAASIAWQKPPFRWVAPYPYAAQVVADYYYGAVAAGNLDIDAIDGELFALDAALAGYAPC